MRTLRAFTFLGLVLLCSLSCAVAQEVKPLISLAVPSVQESTIAAGRDFYVIARVADGIACDVTSASVSLLDAEGRELRRVKSGDTDFKTDYELLNAFNTEQDEWLMPDILYDANDPDSFSYSWNKCYYKDGYIVALVTGGRYQDYIAHQNEDGTPFKELTDGEYALNIDIALADGSTVSKSFPLTLGSGEAKIMSRFAPAVHIYNVTAEADKQGYRTFLDPFPGYWTPSKFIIGQSANTYFGEIQAKWRFADALEYEQGAIHFYLYNVSSMCATQCCEMSCAQLTGAVSDGRMRVYGYDIGEAILLYLDSDGAEKRLTGELTPFENGDILRVARAEVLAENRDDNALNLFEPVQMAVDTDLSDGVTAEKGEFVAFAGMAAPLQNEPKDVIPLGDNAYQTVNRVSKIVYEFRKEGSVVMRAVRDVELTRRFADKWFGDSIYEFSHVFELSAPLTGDIDVRVSALDTYGAPVDGAEAEFKLTVA